MASVDEDDDDTTSDDEDESSDLGKKKKKYGCFIWMAVLGVSSLTGGIYLIQRWETLGGAARTAAIMLTVIGTALLLPVLIAVTIYLVIRHFLNKVTKDLKDATGELAGGADAMVAQNKALYSAPHTFRTADEDDFEDVDKQWYEDTTLRLQSANFRHVGDVVDETIEETSGISPPIRALVSADGTTGVAIYHVNLPGHDMKVCDVSTEFTDGTFLITSNTQGSDLTTPPPRLTKRQHPLHTSPEDLIAAHEPEKAKLLAAKPAGTGAVALHTLDDVLASEKRQQEAKNDFRKEIGYVDPEEVRRIAERQPGMDGVIDHITDAVDRARKKDQQDQ